MITIFSTEQTETIYDLTEKFRTSYNRETMVSTNELIEFLEKLKENRENEITKLYTELLNLKASQL